MKSAAFTLILFFCGCSSTYTVESTDKANKKIGNGAVTIISNTGQEFDAREARITDDSIHFFDDDSNDIRTLSRGDVKSIQRVDHVVGAVEGMILIGVSCGAIGYILASTSGGSGGHPGGAGLGTVFGGAIGGAAGLLIGAIDGHQYTYEFAQDSAAVNTK